MTGRVLMLQGTASSVGKSLMTSALCRVYAQRGLSVAPFKAQNMALNSFVTPEGHEIGRAQAVQAQAAGCTPSVHMNPILLKPEAGNHCQVVLMGRSVDRMSAVQYHEHKPTLGKVIAESLSILRESHDLVIIEGAGSPVEVNLKSRDIVNMFVATLADAPVLIVGDIDRGGIFASLVGTMELLEPDERARVAGFIINKFRGDPALLGNGLDFLHQRTGAPVLGVVPHLSDLCLADEDSTSLEGRDGLFDETGPDNERIDIAVIRWPHISNYDDVLPLEREPSVRLRFVTSADAVEHADLVILPGSKCTVSDLEWFRTTPLMEALKRRAEAGGAILGICGGCQMLGQNIDDPDQVESQSRSTKGLGLLPINTRYQATKTTTQVVARTQGTSFLSNEAPVTGYEIHMGEVTRLPGAAPLLSLELRNGCASELGDGAVSSNGVVVGTMIHGLFDNDGVRSALLRHLRPGAKGAALSFQQLQEAEFDRLAEHVRNNLDMDKIDAIVGLRASKA